MPDWSAYSTDRNISLCSPRTTKLPTALQPKPRTDTGRPVLPKALRCICFGCTYSRICQLGTKSNPPSMATVTAPRADTTRECSRMRQDQTEDQLNGRMNAGGLSLVPYPSGSSKMNRLPSPGVLRQGSDNLTNLTVSGSFSTIRRVPATMDFRLCWLRGVDVGTLGCGGFEVYL